MKMDDLPIDDEVKARISNWVMWCRSNQTRAHCFSIEHRYKAPAQWETPSPHIEVDILDAVIVERAVIGLPVRFKAAMKYAHVMPWVPFHVQVRKIGCSKNEYGDTVRLAEIALRNALRRGCLTKI